ncbi:MAG: glycosyltransferase, partial [Polyangiaceae bacterium]
MRTVLILSRFFPPAFDIGGKRAYRFARYLPEHGWRAAIVTDVAPEGRRADPSAGAPLPDDITVYRTWYPPSWPRPKPADSDGTVVTPTKDKRFPPDGVRARLRWHLRVPVGKELKLTPRAAWLTRRIARDERADALFATSSPYAALVYGVAAKAVTGLPLHLDLRDPWSMNFLQRTKSPFTQKGEAALEGWLLRRADRVTLTSETAAEAYRRAYPDIAGRIGRIYNSFDPAQRPPPPSRPHDGPVTLVHFGNCYGIRRMETVIRAISALARAEGLTPERLRLVNLGRMAEKDVRLAEELGVGDYLEARPVVPYEEGLRILARADLQVLLAYGEETLFVPAKLYDYLLTGAPILCVAPASELTDIV